MKQLDFFDRYPLGPGYQDRETSYLAAKAIASKVYTLREKCLWALEDRNMTADEVADRLRKPIWSVRPRICELATMGLIVDTGTRRINASGKMATVWRRA